MKNSLLPLIITYHLLSLASAHYTWSWLTYDSIDYPEWEFVRPWTNYRNAYQEGDVGGNFPIYDVTSLDIRCNLDGSANTSATLPVVAGTDIDFHIDKYFFSIYHPGPALAYLAKVPEGETAATWNGDGEVWFKIYETVQGIATEGYYAGGYDWLGSFPYYANKITVKLPSSLPSGEYLFRVEHIALHQAYLVNGAQFYMACAQLDVRDGGDGVPGPLIALPGGYSPTDPGILYDMFDTNATRNTYVNPGPPVWRDAS